MASVIRNFPFTSLLSFVGFLLGVAVGVGTKVIHESGAGGIGSNPLGFFTGYFENFFVFASRSILFGLMAGMFFAVIGLIVDFSRKQ